MHVAKLEEGDRYGVYLDNILVLPGRIAPLMRELGQQYASSSLKNNWIVRPGKVEIFYPYASS